VTYDDRVGEVMQNLVNLWGDEVDVKFDNGKLLLTLEQDGSDYSFSIHDVETMAPLFCGVVNTKPKEFVAYLVAQTYTTFDDHYPYQVDDTTG